MSEEQIELLEDEPTQEIELTEETIEETSEEVSEEVQEEEPKKAKPISGYIDYDKIQDEELREAVKMRNSADFRKLKEAERKEAEYQKKLEEYEAKLAEINKPKEVAPPTPDDFYNDPDKAEKQLQAYNEYVAKNADWNSQQQRVEQQRQEQIARQVAERQNAFFAKTKNAGIEEQQIMYAAAVVAPQVPEATADYLLDHDYGPQIVMQLANNPMELQELASLSPFQVGVKLDKMAKAFKPTKVTKAPPPDDPIQGSGVDTRDEYRGLLKGAKFL